MEVGEVMLVAADPPHEDAAPETVISAAATATRVRGIRLRTAALRIWRKRSRSRGTADATLSRIPPTAQGRQTPELAGISGK
jgi:hypothetical protein